MVGHAFPLDDVEVRARGGLARPDLLLLRLLVRLGRVVLFLQQVEGRLMGVEVTDQRVALVADVPTLRRVEGHVLLPCGNIFRKAGCEQGAGLLQRAVIKEEGAALLAIDGKPDGGGRMLAQVLLAAEVLLQRAIGSLQLIHAPCGKEPVADRRDHRDVALLGLLDRLRAALGGASRQRIAQRLHAGGDFPWHARGDQCGIVGLRPHRVLLDEGDALLRREIGEILDDHVPVAPVLAGSADLDAGVFDLLYSHLILLRQPCSGIRHCRVRRHRS
ncbi:hypothetical protein D3C71_607670 [compost metagenome]